MDSAPQSFPPARDVADAAAQLRLVESRRAASRRLAASVWFPLLVGGIATIASPTVVDLIGGDAAPAWYWGFTGPFIGISCALFYASRPIHLPARVALASAGIAIALIAGALLFGFSFGESLPGTPLLAVAAGLGGFAVLYRSLLVAVVAAAYLTAAIALVVTDTIWAEETAYLSIGILSCALAIGALLAMSPESAHD